MSNYRFVEVWRGVSIPSLRENFVKRLLIMASLLCFAGGTVAVTTGCNEQQAKVKEKAKQQPRKQRPAQRNGDKAKPALRKWLRAPRR